MNLKKRIFSFVMVLAMLFTMVQTVALAEEAVIETETSVTETTDETTVSGTVKPENYAVVHITDKGYSGHQSQARVLGVYYNTLYSNYIYSEFGSVVSSFKVPFKDALTGVSVTHYFNSGGMEPGRVVPIFYDFSKFDLNAVNGYYAGPTAEAAETAEYTNAMAFVSNYWPANNGYNYGSTNFANQVAHSVLETTSGKKTYDVTDKVLEGLKASESDYITFATGRETSEYTNASVRVDTESRIPCLTYTYDAEQILGVINNTEVSEMASLLSSLNDAGLFTASTLGYSSYTGLKAQYKAMVEEALYEKISDSGYASVSEFIAEYDASLTETINAIVGNPEIYVNFDDETANNKAGTTNNGTIHGTPEFVTGFNGSKALKIKNNFGKSAQQYLDLGAYDTENSNFTVTFWMRAPERGVEWESSTDAIAAAETTVDFSKYTGTKGGVVFSNKDFSTPYNEGFSFMALSYYSDFAINMQIGENAVNTDGYYLPVDSRWHQLSYVVNRDGYATVYLDNKVLYTKDISSLDGGLGSGNLTFGADALGQYGMNKGEFDEIKVYGVALDSSKIEELYYMNALNQLTAEMEALKTGDNKAVYTEADITELTAKIAEVKAYMSAYQFGNLEALAELHYSTDDYFNNFLNRNTNGMVAFSSDIHISERKETHTNAQNLKKFLQESQDWTAQPDTYVISGDLADVGADDIHIFMEYTTNWIPENKDLVLCRGNHDEPVGKNTETGETLSRENLKNNFIEFLKGWVDTSLEPNKSLLDENGELSTLNFYHTDGIAHYISIDTFWPTTAHISEAQFTWLEATMEMIAGDGKPIFYVQHVPLFNTTKNSTNTKYFNAKDDARLKSILNKYQNVFVFNGHSHHGFGNGSGNPVKIGNIWQINNASMASKEKTRGYNPGTGYYINVYDDRVVFRARDFYNQKWLREYDMTFMLNQPLELYEPIDKINGAESEEKFREVFETLGTEGSIETSENGFAPYTSFDEEWKAYIVAELYKTVADAGYADMTAFLAKYDELVNYVIDQITEDPVVITVYPENYATVHITKTGYSGHKGSARTLGAYYNTPYDHTYAEFGSNIAGFKLPEFKEILSKISVNMNVTKGGMNNGTVPLVYDLNRFDMGLEAGYYAGPKDATDTTEAVEATEGYQKLIEYTTNYWRPNNGYGVTGTNFASQVAHSIKETESGIKTYDVSAKVLDGVKKPETTHITFATGRETKNTVNASFHTNTDERRMKLILEYTAVDIVSYLNGMNTADEMLVALDNLCSIGTFKDTTVGDFGYTTLLSDLKKYVANEVLKAKDASGAFVELAEIRLIYEEAVSYAQENGVLLLVNGVESAEAMETLVNELGEAGTLENSQNGYNSYEQLLSVLKPVITDGLYAVVEDGGFENMDAFYKKYDELVLSCADSGLLDAINSTASESEMTALMAEMGELGLFDSNAENVYNEFTALSEEMKEYVISEIYSVVAADGYSDLSAFYAKYDEAVDYAPIKEILDYVNGVTSVTAMTNAIISLGEEGKLADSKYDYAGYTALNDDMKAYVAETLYETVSNGGFEEITAFYTAYDNAIMTMALIPSKISPENFAVVHITKDGYWQHLGSARDLGVYYNKLYDHTYAEFGSIISGFQVPLKDKINDISIRYHVTAGGLQSGRTIPIFYDFNMFKLNANAGYYAGPTDTTEATAEYTEALAYVSNYWPASGYNYGSTNFASQVAHSILEKESGLKTYDVTSKVLAGLQASENDYITFATGRETSEYANGSFKIDSAERLPTLIMNYDALKVLEAINTATSTELVELIENMGKAGILANTENGYEAWESLSAVCKTLVAEALMDKNYTTFQAFASDYDSAVTTVEEPIMETKMGAMVIADADGEYALASQAAGKAVTITVPVTFAEESGVFTAVLAEYAGSKLKSVDYKDVTVADAQIVFPYILSNDVTEVKVMLLDSVSNMSPLCEAVSDIGGILDGKKVIFIGNSHIYRGLTVVQKQNSVLDQASRSNDKGYFYQLCKANGMDVEVTNWTFGSHGTYHIFGTECTVSGCGCNGSKHEDYLTDKYFDYVFINSATRSTEDTAFVDSVDYIMSFFKEANPNAKFILLGNASSQGVNEYDEPYSAVTAAYKTIAEKGVTIADWGRVVKGVISGEYTVEGAKYPYSKSTFVVKDQYHSNALAGYLTTLTAYCAITGESAEGQPYSFYNDTTLNPKFDMDAYLDEYYANGASDTNADEIFNSKSDMTGLQKLVDKWFLEKPYLNE